MFAPLILMGSFAIKTVPGNLLNSRRNLRVAGVYDNCFIE